MSRTVLYILGAFVIALLAYFLMNRSEDISASCKEVNPRIVAFGDSLVVGYGAEGSGFVEQLSFATGITIDNEGVNGDTTGSALRRIDSILEKNADIVIVLLGGNDALRRIPITETETNLDNILTQIQESGSKIILLGVVGGIPDPYASMYEGLAEKHEAEYVPNVLRGLIGRKEFMADGIHPNVAGHERIRERVGEALAEVCVEIK